MLFNIMVVFIENKLIMKGSVNAKRMIFILICLGMFFLAEAQQSNSVTSNHPERMSISLAGNWQFRTGKKGETPEDNLYHQVLLPGSLDENQFGKKDPGGTRWLTREHSYIGPALYQRKVTIPKIWKNKHIELFLEQCHLKSEVWVDHVKVG